MSKIRIKSIVEKRSGRVVIDYTLDGDPQKYSTSNKVSSLLVAMIKAGYDHRSSKGGRHLDGREWNQFPNV